MILQRIVVENFGSLRGLLDVGPLNDRITILHAPQGFGKSTLADAVSRALFDRPDTADAAIEARIPWGSAGVKPRMALEFTLDGEAFRLEKVFGRPGETKLDRRENGRFVRWKEGRDAVEWAREQLGSRAPGRGATKPEHWGLAQLLFVQQGLVPLDRGGAIGEGLKDRLQAVVGEVAALPAARALRDLVEEQYGSFFTAGGRPKERSPVREKEEGVRKANADRGVARQLAESLGALSHELELAEEEVGRLEKRKDELFARREVLAPRAKEYAGLLAERDRQVAKAAEAERAFRERADQIRRIEDLREKAKTAAERLRDLDRREKAATETLEAAAREAAESTRKRQKHEEASASVRAERRRAEDARRFVGALDTIRDLESRHGAIQEKDAAIEDLEKKIRETAAPSGRRIGALRDALAEERSAREALEAALLRVRVRAHKGLQIASGEGIVQVEKDETRQFQGEGRVVFSIEGVATIELSGPTENVVAAKDRQRRALEQVEVLAAELGSRDPTELEVRYATERELERQRDVAKAARASLLREKETPKTLREKLEEEKRARDQFLITYSAWKSEPPDAPALTTGARDAEARYEDELTRLREDEQARRAAIETARELLERIRAEREASGKVLALAEGGLKTETRDGLTDEAREERRREASRSLQEAKDLVHLAEEALKAFPEDPSLELGRVQREIEALLQDLPRKREDRGRREQALADAIRRGPHSRLAEAEEKVVQLENELRQAQLEADAFGLLYRLFDEEHRERSKQLFAPVSARLLPRLRRLFGPRFEEVEFSEEDFRLAGIRVRGLETAVEPGSLSFGEQDQLGLLVRLGLGELAAGAGRLPAILDEPLAHADSPHLGRFLGILEEISERIQLLVLTSTPLDYRGLSIGTFIDLKSGPSPERAARVDTKA